MIRVYEPIGQIYGVTSRTQRLIQKYQSFLLFKLICGKINVNLNLYIKIGENLNLLTEESKNYYKNLFN